jgi:hypothetical protein
VFDTCNLTISVILSLWLHWRGYIWFFTAQVCLVLASGACTELSQSHAIHIKIFIGGCSSVQFDWINKHTVSLWLYSPSGVFNSRSARMSFSQVQRVFIVQHYLASRSYLTCQNEFRDTFLVSPVPNRSTVSRLVNRFRSLQKHFTELYQTWGKEWIHASLNAVDISNT